MFVGTNFVEILSLINAKYVTQCMCILLCQSELLMMVTLAMV